MKKRIIILTALLMLILTLMVLFLACVPDENDYEELVIEDKSDKQEIVELPEYILPTLTIVNLSETDITSFVDFMSSIYVAYSPIEDYEAKYSNAYEYWMEGILEKQIYIEQVLGSAGTTEQEIMQLCGVFNEVSTWLKTTKGGTHRFADNEAYADWYMLNLLVEQTALSNLQEYIQEIIEIFPSERTAILIFDMLLNNRSAKSIYSYSTQIEDAKNRGFGEVENLLTTQGKIEWEYVSRRDFAFWGEIVYEVICILGKFDAPKLAKIINFIVNLANFKDFSQLKSAGGYSYKEMVSIINYTGELLTELKDIGKENWVRLTSMLMDMLYDLGKIYNYGQLITHITQSLEVDKSFSFISLIANILKDLKVSDVTNLYADYDDWNKARVTEKEQKLAVLVARISGILSSAYNKLTIDEQTHLNLFFASFDNIKKNIFPDINIDYDLVKMLDFWEKVESFAALGNPDKLSKSEKEEIFNYTKGLIDVFSGQVPHRNASLTEPISFILESGTTKEMFLEVINGINVSVKDYSKNEDGSYTYYKYEGEAIFTPENIPVWETSNSTKTITLKLNNEMLVLDNLATPIVYPHRIFDLDIEVIFYSKDTPLKCSKYFSYCLSELYLDEEMSKSKLNTLFIFTDSLISLEEAEQVTLYGFDTEEIGYNKIGYGIAEFDFATVAFSTLYNVILPPSS